MVGVSDKRRGVCVWDAAWVARNDLWPAVLSPQHYGQLMEDFISDDHDHDVSVTSLSVQIYTVPSLVGVMLVGCHCAHCHALFHFTVLCREPSVLSPNCCPDLVTFGQCPTTPLPHPHWWMSLYPPPPPPLVNVSTTPMPCWLVSPQPQCPVG